MHETAAGKISPIQRTLPWSGPLNALCRSHGILRESVYLTVWALVVKTFAGVDSVPFHYYSVPQDPFPSDEDAITKGSTPIHSLSVDFAPTCSVFDLIQNVQWAHEHNMRTLLASGRRVNSSNQNDGLDHAQDSIMLLGTAQSLSSLDGKCETCFGLAVSLMDHGDETKISIEDRKGRSSVLELEIFARTFETGLGDIHKRWEQVPAQVKLLSSCDMAQILEWNSGRPEAVEDCVHKVISRRALMESQSQAIHAWDGDLNYGSLDKLSTKLGQLLVKLGIGMESVVPLCFERSKWVVVSMLAVNKAGAAFVLLNPSHPFSRLKSIISQVKASIVITSPYVAHCVSQLVERKLQVDDALLESIDQTSTKTVAVAAHSAAYLVFSSGTTGVPKGVVIEHKSFCTFGASLAKVTQMNHSHRVMSSAAYNWDACLEEILVTLMVGGTVCMPSQDDLDSDIPGSISRMNVNWASLTPSLARYIASSDLPTLHTVVLGGEQMTDADIDLWKNRVRLFNLYGPSECCPTSCINSSATQEFRGGNIGRGVGCVTWIVDPTDHEILLPIGAVGELVLDGPIVGRGYVHEPEKTKAAFIRSPRWLPKRYSEGPTHHLYKTGDLVRYCTNGTLEYIGRKDDQMKIRGQRLEPREIERRIRESTLPTTDVVVDVAYRAGEEARQVLAAFVVLSHSTANRHKGPYDCTLSNATIISVRQSLAQELPEHMIPSIFLVVKNIPLTTSSKVDRQRLRELVRSLDEEEFLSATGSNPERRSPETRMERMLRRLWASVLRINEERIGLDDDFRELGGDSISAMKLASAARRENLSLTVADIFRSSSLQKMAAAVSLSKQRHAEILPFSLVPKRALEDVLQAATTQCHTKVSMIEDLYPCTPLQAGLMALSIRYPESYVAHDIFELPGCMDIRRFQGAWNEVVRHNAILRTRIIQFGSRMYQVVLQEQGIWERPTDLKTYLEHVKKVPRGLGDVLHQLALVENDSRKAFLVWTIHHSLEDGWSRPLLLEQVARVYAGLKLAAATQYNQFIRYLEENARKDWRSFWTSQIGEARPQPFPSLPTLGYSPRPDTFLERTLKWEQKGSLRLSPDNLLCAAWAITVSRYTECLDVSFGVTVFGRNALLEGIDEITGPTFSTVPFFVRLDTEESVKSLLERLQRISADRTEFEHSGLDAIKGLGRHAEAVCDFQTLLVVQPVQPENESLITLGLREVAQEIPWFDTYPLNLECQLTASGLVMKARFDSAVIESFKVERMILQFGYVLQQLSFSDTKVKDIEVTSPDDLALVAQWNEKKPRYVQACVHQLFLEQSRRNPSAEAVCAWDGSFSFHQLDNLSHRLGEHLRSRGVKPEILVPLCFDKSKWTVVAMLAVLRAGGGCVFLDPINHPPARMMSIIEDIDAPFAICAPRFRQRLRDMVPSIISLEHSFLEQLPTPETDDPTDVQPDNVAFVMFTSGSTGKPKGIVHDHRAICSSYLAFGPSLHIGSHSRIFQFAAYTFDVCISDIVAPLLLGGCVCIPSESDRVNDIVGSIKRLNANWVLLTPSFARHIEPEQTSNLKTLCLAGETVLPGDKLRWAGHLDLIVGYGPAEVSLCTAGSLAIDGYSPPTIGNMVGGLGWITEVSNPTKLAPIGVNGELLVEGPIVARGYLKRPEQTATSFIQVKDWLSNGDASPRRRLYKTGDLVKYNSDGSLQFQGRRDTQVKVRGQRIEVGEIETNLQRLLAEKMGKCDCAVELIYPSNDPSNACLAAFITNTSAGTEIDEKRSKGEQLQQRIEELHICVTHDLAKVLPPYMIPSNLIFLDSMPTTPSRKLNRMQLRLIGSRQSKLKLDQYAKPRKGETAKTEMEKKLQNLWSRILQVEPAQIMATDSFLQLGGDSLRAIALVSAARAERISLTVADVFRHVTLRNMAAASRDQMPDKNENDQNHGRGDEPSSWREREELVLAALEKVPLLKSAEEVEDIRPCTPMQENFLFARRICHKFYQPEMRFTVVLSRNAKEELIDVGRLHNAWRHVVARHSVLRSIFVPLQQSETHYQLVLRSWEPEVFVGHDDEGVEDLFDATRRFRPPHRLSISPISETRAACKLRLSHALLDGGCVDALLDDLDKAYANNNALPTKPGPQYRDFQRYLVTRSAQPALDFWSSYLDHVAPSILPGGIALAPEETPLFDRFRTQRIRLPAARALRGTCRRHGVTLPMLFQAAWALTVRHFTRCPSVVFGHLVANRDLPVHGAERIIGPMLGMLARRVHVDGGEDPTFGLPNVLDRIRRDCVGCLPHQHLSLPEHCRRLHGTMSRPTLFNTLINHRNFSVPQPGGEDAQAPWLSFEDIKAYDPFEFDILLGIDDDGEEQVEAQLDYWATRVTGDRAQEIADVFANLMVAALHSETEESSNG